MVSSQPRRPAADSHREQDVYCGNMASCRWNWLGSNREHQVRGESADRDGHRDAGDLRAAQPPPYGRRRPRARKSA